jgi:hypothetical protein
MSIKDKIMNIVTAQPKLMTLGIGLGITLVAAAVAELSTPASALLNHGDIP